MFSKIGVFLLNIAILGGLIWAIQVGWPDPSWIIIAASVW